MLFGERLGRLVSSSKRFDETWGGYKGVRGQMVGVLRPTWGGSTLPSGVWSQRGMWSAGFVQVPKQMQLDLTVLPGGVQHSLLGAGQAELGALCGHGAGPRRRAWGQGWERGSGRWPAGALRLTEPRVGRLPCPRPLPFLDTQQIPGQPLLWAGLACRCFPSCLRPPGTVDRSYLLPS